MGGVRLTSENGKTMYEQTVPIPAYLLAVAAGAIVSRPLGKMYELEFVFLFFSINKIFLLLFFIAFYLQFKGLGRRRNRWRMCWRIFRNITNVGPCWRHLWAIPLESVRFAGYATQFPIWWNGKSLSDNDYAHFVGEFLRCQSIEYAFICDKNRKFILVFPLFACVRPAINHWQQLLHTKFRTAGPVIWWQMPTMSTFGWTKGLRCFWKGKLPVECLAKRLEIFMPFKVSANSKIVYVKKNDCF